MAKQYVRTDKNGTKIYHDYTCDRCGGKGIFFIGVCNGVPVPSHVDEGVCFKCFGSGKMEKPEVIKEYTPEYRAILDARAAKRQEKKLAEAQAEKAAKQAEWKQSKGFVNDRIHVVGISNSFERKEEIKAAGGRFNEYVGWYFSEPHEEFKTVELTTEECLYENRFCGLDWVAAWKIREILKAKLPANPSRHLGQVGGKIEVEATFKRTRWYDTQFGTTWIYTFEDNDGNCLVWKTSASIEPREGDKVRIKGTVKEHDEYNGVKQTVLTRCKIA